MQLPQEEQQAYCQEKFDSIKAAEDYNHVDNWFSVGFTYSPNGSTAMDHLNNVRLSGYEWNLDGKLEPNKEYKFNAVVQDHCSGNRAPSYVGCRRM